MIEPPHCGMQPIPSLVRHKSAKILIVEDEKIVAWDMEQTLRDAGLEHIAGVHSLHKAREIAAGHNSVSLVLLDLKLGDDDCTPLLHEFRARRIPVVIVTGYASFEHSDVPVLYKPVATEDLVRITARVLDGTF